jgi:hypothetical protein
LISKLSPLSTVSVFGLYLSYTSFTVISPLLGHSPLTRLYPISS